MEEPGMPCCSILLEEYCNVHILQFGPHNIFKHLAISIGVDSYGGVIFFFEEIRTPNFGFRYGVPNRNLRAMKFVLSTVEDFQLPSIEDFAGLQLHTDENELHR